MTARALYVSAFVPDEQAEHAGGQAAFQNRAEIERQGFEVTSLVCTTERRAKSNVTDQTVYSQSPSRLLFGWARSLLAGQVTGLSAWRHLDTRANTAFERRLRAELQTGAYELVFADFTQVLLPVRRALKGMAVRPRICACAHDLFVQKLLRDPGLTTWFSLGPVTRNERRLLQWVDELVTLSPKDEALATLLYDCTNVRTKAFVAPRWVAQVNRVPEQIAPREVLFFANFDRPENAEALAWFTQSAMPQVAHAHPDFCLVLAGAGSDSVAVANEPANLRRLGFLADPSAAFARCRLAIAPLARGAGVKFKVLEALSCGVPVLGTAVALEGISRSPLVNEATRAEFADVLTKLLAAA